MYVECGEGHMGFSKPVGPSSGPELKYTGGRILIDSTCAFQALFCASRSPRTE